MKNKKNQKNNYEKKYGTSKEVEVANNAKTDNCTDNTDNCATDCTNNNNQ